MRQCASWGRHEHLLRMLLLIDLIDFILKYWRLRYEFIDDGQP